MGHISGSNRCQQKIMCLDDYVDKDSVARAIDCFVDTMDLEALGFRNAVPNALGRNSYSPGHLVKLYVYGYESGTRSSRKLEALTKLNIEAMWLMDELKPDFKTIADFRKDNLCALVSLSAYRNGAYETYSYDKKGRQTASSSYMPSGGLDFRSETAYDNKDRVKTVSDYGASGALTRRTGYTYDVFGCTTSFAEQDAAGRTSKYVYHYDRMDRVTKIDYPADSVLDGLKGESFTYGKFGRLTGVDMVMSLGSLPLRRYSYDAWGQIASMADSIGGADTLVRNYVYDIFGMTTRITVSSAADRGNILEQ